ncbi:MAG: class I SAM-dependent methyltransferase [Acidobacteria bacterium]|nr:class I SAM-dependent methyltransferase [Acidobacteriota bacterium]
MTDWRTWIRKRPGLRTALIRLLNLGWSLFPLHDGVPGPHIRRFARRIGESAEILEIGGAGLSYRELFTCRNFICLDLRAEAPVNLMASVYALPFRDQCIQTVLLFEVLEHLAEPREALREIIRSLKPGGLLAITTPQYWHEHGWPSDYFRYTRHGLCHLAESSGFEVESLTPMGGPALLTSLVLSNNFGLGKDPIRRLLICLPLTWVCYLLDKTVFRNNLTSENPDTRGWAVILRRPGPARQDGG